MTDSNRSVKAIPPSLITAVGLMSSQLCWFAGLTSVARAIVDALIRMFPANSEAYLVMGNYCERSGRLIEAVSWYERARDLAPHSAAVYLELASILEKNGNRRSAAEHYQRFLYLSPESSAEFRSEISDRIVRLREVEH